MLNLPHRRLTGLVLPLAALASLFSLNTANAQLRPGFPNTPIRPGGGIGNPGFPGGNPGMPGMGNPGMPGMGNPGMGGLGGPGMGGIGGIPTRVKTWHCPRCNTKLGEGETPPPPTTHCGVRLSGGVGGGGFGLIDPAPPATPPANPPAGMPGGMGMPGMNNPIPPIDINRGGALVGGGGGLTTIDEAKENARNATGVTVAIGVATLLCGLVVIAGAGFGALQSQRR